MASQEFTKISYKRKSRRPPTLITQQLAELTICDDFDHTKAIQRVLDAKDDILTSDYYSNVQASISEALSLQQPSKSTSKVSKKSGHSAFKELVCFGIGHVAECIISRHQFALIVLLKELYCIEALKVCDPALTLNDSKVLQHFAIEIIEDNIEAKYVAHTETLFYLPHCPKQLSNNLLWANWSAPKLNNCTVIANSFHSLIEGNTKRELIENAEYILRINAHVTEIAICNTFKYFEVFNDCAVHVFPNLSLIDENTWRDCDEPKYLKDVEYVEASTTSGKQH